MKALTIYFKNREDAINFLLEKPAGAYTPATFHKLHVIPASEFFAMPEGTLCI